MEHAGTGIFFLSTGRCGTQWLQKTLTAAYPDAAVVRHEPVRGAYEPKLYLRAYDRLEELLSSEEVARHLAHIREILKSKTYIETGWPCYPALPLIIDQLGGRVRIVHLVRHPVYVALSLATHQVYEERQDWISRAAITPFDQGVVQKELAGVWDEMSSYEKCLFWWTEINLYALELKGRRPDVEFFFVRYEDLFDPGTQELENLIRFMNLPYEPSVREFRLENVDRYRRQSPPVDWELIYKYARTTALAKQLGYDLNDVSAQRIATRYFSGGQERPGGKWHRVLTSMKKFAGPRR